MYCKNCGKELKDNEICDCVKNKINEKKKCIWYVIISSILLILVTVIIIMGVKLANTNEPSVEGVAKNTIIEETDSEEDIDETETSSVVIQPVANLPYLLDMLGVDVTDMMNIFGTPIDQYYDEESDYYVLQYDGFKFLSCVYEDYLEEDSTVSAVLLDNNMTTPMSYISGVGLADIYQSSFDTLSTIIDMDNDYPYSDYSTGELTYQARGYITYNQCEYKLYMTFDGDQTSSICTSMRIV